MFVVLALAACTARTDTAGPADDGSVDSPAPDAEDSGAPEAGGLGLDAPPKNVLMVVLDTARRDAVGHYGGVDTPHLDRLLSESVTLDHHRSCSNWTWDAILCAQTGREPWDMAFAHVDEEGDPIARVPVDVPLVSEELETLGFQTALISAQIFMSASSGFDRGFGTAAYVPDGRADELTDAALLVLGQLEAEEEPWYLHLHYLDPHIVYDPPEAYLSGLEGLADFPYDLGETAGYGEMLADWDDFDDTTRALAIEHLTVRYRGEMSFFDAELGRLLEGAEASGALEDTLVVFWTDHGEQLYQHDYPSHGASLFDEETLGVAAFCTDDIVPQAWSGPTTLADLWPTALEAMGLETELGATGVPLGGRPDDEALITTRFRGDRTQQSADRNGTKLIYNWSGTKSLYRTATDPGEVDDVYDSDDAEVQALWDDLLPRVEALHELLGGPAPVDPGA